MQGDGELKRESELEKKILRLDRRLVSASSSLRETSCFPEQFPGLGGLAGAVSLI